MSLKTLAALVNYTCKSFSKVNPEAGCIKRCDWVTIRMSGSASLLVASAYGRLACVASVSERVCEKFGKNGYAG